MGASNLTTRLYGAHHLSRALEALGIVALRSVHARIGTGGSSVSVMISM
ncbi:hypothetical protein AKJ09_06294 [Labilithrix luteola]|uniref:Uncharacterized protein n=1 Tax=Labilithrix luteola TaxID=1391654 RepID=A0A0K1Q1G1_9BACT|nr:hypothetical protein AKJ09_06294 [Labilithrix luteola]